MIMTYIKERPILEDGHFTDKLKLIMHVFLKDTEMERTVYSSEHDIPSIRKPTFEDFLNWIEQQ